MPPDTLTGQSLWVDEVLRRDHDTDLRTYLTTARGRGDSYNTIAHELSNSVDVDGFTVTNQWVYRWCHRLGIEG